MAQTDKNSMEELVMSQAYALEAIMNLLEKKGIINREEIIEELKQMQTMVLGKMKMDVNPD